MYGGVHIATVDGIFKPRSPADGLYHVWFAYTEHAHAHDLSPVP